MVSSLHRDTHLWPAGHLPQKGGDHKRLAPRPNPLLRSVVSRVAFLFTASLTEARQCTQLISPLVGEMASRPEGGWHGTTSAIGEATQ